ncbi:golgi-body localization protein domain-containing protein [Cyathus striatus]|nr:golgi-body localization protein domain-containing protein [Cyathus striatus]
MVLTLFQAFFNSLWLLLFGGADGIWAALLIWFIRIVTFSLFFRTHIGPWIFAVCTKHFRVRSVSLRSMRGAYFRQGTRTWRADRISYSMYSPDGSIKWAIKVEGLTLWRPLASVSRHRRNLTLADLNPSPLARWIWELIWAVYVLIEPYFRPFVRTYAVSCMRLAIRWLPGLAESMSFDFYSTVVTFEEMPGTKIDIDHITLHISLNFTDLERQTTRMMAIRHAFYSVAAWRKRMTDSFQRALDRAWGEAHGTASILLNLRGIAGTTLQESSCAKSISFFVSPGSIDFAASVRFNPRAGKIDDYSLESQLIVGDCSVKVDLVNKILGTLRKHAATNVAASPSGYPDSPLQSSYSFLSSRTSWSLPSSALPVSPIFSPFELSPAPSKDLDYNLSPIETPKSPGSPFLRAISASIRPRRRYFVNRCTRLKDLQNQSTLSVLRSVNVSVSTITLTTSADRGVGSYRATIRNITLEARLGDPSLDLLHRQWFGRSQKQQCFDADIYALNFDVQKILLERLSKREDIQLLRLSPLNVQVITSQYPAPWLIASPFMDGDPNAPFVASRISVGSIQFTEQLDELQRALASIPSSKEPISTKSAYSLPRFSVEARCDALSEEAFAMELRNKGFSFSAYSNYDLIPMSFTSCSVTPGGLNPARLNCAYAIAVEPTELRIRKPLMPTRIGKSLDPSETGFLANPLLFSLGILELSGNARAPANVGVSNVASSHLHCSSFCVQLWHSDVIDAVSFLLSLSSDSEKAVPTPIQSLSRPPAGFSVMVSMSKCVFFITAPDINPADKIELCRGIAFRSDMSVAYSAVRLSHHCNQNRAKLNLPQEAMADAIDACKQSGSSSDVFARANASFSRAMLRSAVASHREPDDPAMADHDADFESLEFFRASNAQVSIFLASRNGAVFGPNHYICDVDANIKDIWADFQLAHVYNTMLALRTVRRLVSKKDNMARSRPSNPYFSFKLNIKLETLQIMCNFLEQKLAIRIDDIETGIKSHSPPTVSFARLASWVPVRHISPWGGEFVTLNGWLVRLDIQPSMLPHIDVEGNGARLRIPHGFILADLIFDISVIAKALRHTIHMTAAGLFSDMPSPEAEGPKSIPRLTFHIQCLCLEAQDDPFETRREAASRRQEREEAFMAKVAAIQGHTDISNGDLGYRFNSAHSVTIEEARRRLDDVHQLDWSLRLEKGRETWSREESAISHKLAGDSVLRRSKNKVPNIISESKSQGTPPLIRATLSNLDLNIAPPSFALDDLPLFMNTHGDGLPLDTLFSLLIPMHILVSLSSLRITLRDYPLPLVSVPISGNSDAVAFSFDTDLVIGEEMGTDLSVDWISCLVIGKVKAQILPTSEATLLSWSISYGPAIQDVMRIIETLSTPPRDPSPTMGFWDKVRLVFHWQARILFHGDVRLYLKGSRNPYKLHDDGAGFVLCWQGDPELRVGYTNDEGELIQVTSNSMLIAIPKLASPFQIESTHPIFYSSQSSEPFQKVCAKFGSGIRFGVGFVLERACGHECKPCEAQTSFHRKCRFFDFKPHYAVKLEKKLITPERKANDSYNGFRSDFIHLSVSLTSSLSPSSSSLHNTSSLHLTPKSFAHFFSWWSLFDNVLSLPVRQGNYYPTRHVSPKLGRHLATLKYRIHVQHMSVIHAYIDDSRETWVDGVTPWVGVKGMIEEFQVDMHQRDEEIAVVGPFSDAMKIIHRKPFYAAEVVLKGLDLQVLLATFAESLKQAVEMTAPSQRSNYRKRSNIPTTPLSSYWYDSDDFVEVDWTSQVTPILHLLPLATCPHFVYFKRNSALTSSPDAQTSKFGIERSHVCLLGKETTVLQVQARLALARIEELKSQLNKWKQGFDKRATEKMIALLEEYVSVLQEAEGNSEAAHSSTDQNQHYHMPSDIVSPDEWAEFDNVYQIHCPNIFMDSATRDIVLQYYYCSRARRGFEYHMATRAVKFIRDQAETVLPQTEAEEEPEKGKLSTSNTAQFAASALRKILKVDNQKASVEITNDAVCDIPEGNDPLDGWAEGVSLKRSHCCLLLKPQIIMRGEGTKEACIVASAHAKLQSYAIMDNANLKDSVSGKVMSRNYSSVSGLQTFATTRLQTLGNGHVPLEVLIDLRCESCDFERLVPQTDAKFHYDKFNRLRLRNNVTSVATRVSTDKPLAANHLQDQTDLIRVHIPRFTVSANDEHFHIISNIVTKLLLFSDAAHKTRLDKLETLLFTYDFTDLESAANVVSNLQGRLRDAMKSERIVMRNPRRLEEEADRLALMKLKAHIFLLAEELNLLFDAIKLAQDRFDDQTDQKSALLLHASSSEISWRMLDERRNLLAKLVVQDSNFYWLSRQDSSTVNNLAIGDLTAFDGSRHAIWAEILSKHYEPANHPLLKRGLFLLANWTILPPVGGIAIYECFELDLHPLRLQIDAKVGRRIMEYVWPSRRNRQESSEPTTPATPATPLKVVIKSPVSSRSSLDSPRTLHHTNLESKDSTLTPPLRKLGSSRSFTDLRSSKDTRLLKPFTIQRTHSSESLMVQRQVQATGLNRKLDDNEDVGVEEDNAGDAAVMKTRSSQKTFVLVKISSLDLLLSIVKEGSFEFHDARIKTRELEYHNQTWSFEELGWVKMALHQPLVPVLPVARELISKTKWTTSKSTPPHEHPLQLLHPKGKGRQHGESGLRHLTSLPFTAEPESMDNTVKVTDNSRKRVFSIFNRSRSQYPSSKKSG